MDTNKSEEPAIYQLAPDIGEMAGILYNTGTSFQNERLENRLLMLQILFQRTLLKVMAVIFTKTKKHFAMTAEARLWK